MVTRDEEQPLLRHEDHEVAEGPVTKETELNFDPGDPQNPQEWSQRFKWSIVALLALMSFTVTYTCIGIMPIAMNIVEDLDGQRGSAASTALLVTIWELGEATGPLFIAPLSEVFGRYPVVNVCTVIFIIATLLSAWSGSTTQLIVARFFTGFAVSTNVLGPSIIGDIFKSEQRGSALSMITLAPLMGGAIGPAVAGAIAQTLGWREVLLIAAIPAVLAEVLFLTCFRETYKTVILQRRGTRSQQKSSSPEAQVHRPQSATPTDCQAQIWHKIARALARPFIVLFSSGVLLALAVQASVSFSFFYVMSVSLPVILQDEYNWTPAGVGASFIVMSAGSIISSFICNLTLDRIYISLRDRSSTPSVGKPEFRLPLVILSSILLPFGVLAYGWIADLVLPAPLLLLAVAFLDFTLLMNILALQAYVVDATGLFSASAMTGVIVLRCLVGTFLPLVTGTLIGRGKMAVLGYGWGFTVLAGVAALTAVIPVVVFKNGERWRQRSVYTKS